MQDMSYIHKIVSGKSFEELEKILQGRIIELKQAYKIEDYDYAKDLRIDVERSIADAKEAIKIPGHRIRLAKEEKKYSILINLGRIYGGPENGHVLDKLLEKVQYNDITPEEEIFGFIKEEDSDLHPVTKSFKKSANIKLKQKSYHELFSDYNQLWALINSADKKLKDAPVRKVEGTFIRKDLQNQLKLLRKNHYQKKILDKESLAEFNDIMKKAKENYMGFEDIKNSYELFLKDVVEYEG